MLVRRAQIDGAQLNEVRRAVSRMKEAVQAIRDQSQGSDQRLGKVEARVADIEGRDIPTRGEVEEIRRSVAERPVQAPPSQPEPQDMSPVLDVLSRVEGLLQAASKPRVYRFDIERSGGLIVNVTATEDGSSPDLAEIAPEIAKLEALMRDRPAEYLADGAARQRYAGLLEKRDKAVRG